MWHQLDLVLAWNMKITSNFKSFGTGSQSLDLKFDNTHSSLCALFLGSGVTSSLFSQSALGFSSDTSTSRLGLTGALGDAMNRILWADSKALSNEFFFNCLFFFLPKTTKIRWGTIHLRKEFFLLYCALRNAVFVTPFMRTIRAVAVRHSLGPEHTGMYRMKIIRWNFFTSFTEWNFMKALLQVF